MSDGWLSYTAVTPRASLQSDANNNVILNLSGYGCIASQSEAADAAEERRLTMKVAPVPRHKGRGQPGNYVLPGCCLGSPFVCMSG